MSIDVLAALEHAFVAHGVAAERRADSVVAGDGRMVIVPNVVDGETDGTVMLQVVVTSSRMPDKAIVERVAGFGDTREDAIRQAIEKVIRGAWHVLLEGLTDHSCQSTQSDREQWVRDGITWDVFSGPLLAYGKGENPLADSYPQFFPKLEALFKATAGPGPHWVSTFICTYRGELKGAEVLLDNKPWDAGQDLVRAEPWQRSDEYQSIRHFLLALPAVSKH